MTTASPATAWIEFLLAEETAFERLVRHDPRIAKFGRVLNDERVASELRVEDVARMLGLPTGVLLAVARGHPDGAATIDPPAVPHDSPWAEAASRRVPLDLRPIFADGHEPLAIILDHVRHLPDGAALVIDAPFHPVPLRRLLGGRGYQSMARSLAPDHWRVAFRPAPPA